MFVQQDSEMIILYNLTFQFSDHLHDHPRGVCYNLSKVEAIHHSFQEPFVLLCFTLVNNLKRERNSKNNNFCFAKLDIFCYDHSTTGLMQIPHLIGWWTISNSPGVAKFAGFSFVLFPNEYFFNLHLLLDDTKTIRPFALASRATGQ